MFNERLLCYIGCLIKKQGRKKCGRVERGRREGREGGAGKKKRKLFPLELDIICVNTAVWVHRDFNYQPFPHRFFPLFSLCLPSGFSKSFKDGDQVFQLFSLQEFTLSKA